MDPIGLIFIGLTVLLLLLAIVIPQIQKRRK
jgi:type II secretory pathway component PulF